MFFDYNKLELERDNKKLSGKSPNIWELNNTNLNNLGVRGEIKRA